MNREESIALFKQGREAWNAWAAEKFAERQALEDGRRWRHEEFDDEPTEEAKRWQAEVTSDFGDRTFVGEVDFSGFMFPGPVNFNRVTFRGNAGFDGAVFEGDAKFGGTTFEGTAQFRHIFFKNVAWFGGAAFKSDATFRGSTFEDVVGFDRAIFARTAEFGGATCKSTGQFTSAIFNGTAVFRGATFKDALFNGATFKGNAGFAWAQFRGQAGFDGVTFKGEADFDVVIFKGIAWFRLCRFLGAASFSRCRFAAVANFSAIDSVRAFSLAETKFQAVPDFIQAHFSEAPRCDDLTVAAGSFWRRVLSNAKWRLTGGSDPTDTNKPKSLFQMADPHLPARWRALKRLAIQGHDNEHEQMFFKGELVARRWHVDQPWHAAFWFAALYGLLSDYGRSLLRPLFGWALCAAVFAAVYLSQHAAFQPPERSFLDRLVALEITTPPLHCEQGDDNPISAAFDLSVRNALLFVGQTSRDKLRQNYACLYGQETRVSHFVVFMVHLQNVISAILIFLFLLGVRNHFKIK